VNLIKMLSHTTYGTERQTLIKGHSLITASIHKNSTLIFTKLTKKDERKLNTKHTRSLKYAIGVFVTLPNTCIHTETYRGIMPLKHHRKVQLLKQQKQCHP
jgi:hypothetical protein